ncbi:MAG TPA: protein kinase, partial [Nannocystaceae bacterium]|nr:protein kinase [Nannocystaceae bacterium]
MDEVTALTQAAPERAIDTDPTEYSARTLGDGESTTSPVPADAATIGRFAVLRKLGEGGMGTVFAAYDERLDRKIAVKVLHSVDARARMLREAQALAKLSHPNVVQVYEIGEDHGLVFIAMEFVNGTTLKGWCEGRARAWVELLDVFVQAGRGLHAAHVRGLV